MKRLTLQQILAHPWFTSHELHYEESSDPEFERSSSPEHKLASSSEASHSTSATSHSSTSDSNYTSAPTTPDDSIDDPFTVGLSDSRSKDHTFIHRNPSETTIRTKLNAIQDLETTGSKIATVMEEEDVEDVFVEAPGLAGGSSANTSSDSAPNPRRMSTSSSRSHAPPMSTVRTPARTKRRSVSSTLSLSSNPSSPTMEKAPTLPDPSTTQGPDIDFASLLSTPAPIIFSTPLERQLLNTLSMLGFDLGQICYSVMHDACDSAGALWWIMMKKAEARERERREGGPATEQDPASATLPLAFDTSSSSSKPKSSPNKKARGVQTDRLSASSIILYNPPQVGIVPPTPTTAGLRPATPPPANQLRSTSPTSKLTPSPSNSLLEPNPRSSSLIDSPLRSHPSTPGSKGRKGRSGSVSIMQRATTALEAAGLVRKKSSEGVREQKERDGHTQSQHSEKERDKSKETERKSLVSDDGRTGSVSKLTKSPPMKPTKAGPSTPPPSEKHHPQSMDSPWVLAESKDSLGGGKSAPTPANSPGDGFSSSISSPQFGSTGKSSNGSNRNRANILTSLRLWFHEDRKGKRKENVSSSSQGGSRFSNYNASSPPRQYSTTNVKRHTSGNGSKSGSKRRSHRTTHRASVSSRRSSSVNSRRSSVASMQMVVMDSPIQQPRRSLGSYTPSSEKGEYIEYGSRPSSIRSVSRQGRNHRKSPSASSNGSVTMRTASPGIKQFHRRGSSGGSTRVVRQHSAGAPKPAHVRSNSAASSIPSPVSSRPASFIEYSENEGQRTGSPAIRNRRDSDATPRRGGGTTFIQKRQGPFSSPIHGYGNSIGRSSWKKSWGLEPPGWQTRTTHLPVEVLAISPSNEPTSIRDVFSGRLSLGDESDWVDEDEEVPYAAGLGQMVHGLNSSTSSTSYVESTVMLSPAPRGHRSNKRNANGPSSNGPNSGRQKAPTAGRASPVQPESNYEPPLETRTGRRQLPPSRSGPAAIQEEDEEEEE